MSVKDLKESQAMCLREASLYAILTELARFEIARGTSQANVLAGLESLTSKAIPKLYLPPHKASQLAGKAMIKAYNHTPLRERLYKAAVENFVMPETFDWDSAEGEVGLPAAFKPAAESFMESVRHIDESGEAILKTCGAEVIDECLKAISTELPKEFLARL